MKTKAQVSFSVTAQLMSTFVFATLIEQFLFFINPKLQASSLFLRLYRPVCDGPSRKPRRPVFSRCGSIKSHYLKTCFFYTRKQKQQLSNHLHNNSATIHKFVFATCVVDFLFLDQFSSSLIEVVYICVEISPFLLRTLSDTWKTFFLMLH